MNNRECRWQRLLITFAFALLVDLTVVSEQSGTVRLSVRDVRFVGGVGLYDGGVEVLVGDTWGQVCGYISNYTRHTYSVGGHVFCQMKGLQTPHFGDKCIDGAVALVCTDCGQVNVSNGQITTYNDTSRTLTIRCHTDDPAYVQYICGNNGLWNKTAECMPVNIQDIRLMNQALYLYQGTVELKINGTWGTICDGMFAKEEATVLCRMLNAR
ncbi:hypothetical protein DPMN_017143 [Dreissena polymorpha]|uniref:SRCR domain-containing protein n=1 Tax=Dreissena polymorpha TaxID=45954 RepID=A0A9D4NEM8_DREPO|nr:hypothetical protein DPMN_017143 [Dreissena polymorpha]